jgi:hypothetical protein
MSGCETELRTGAGSMAVALLLIVGAVLFAKSRKHTQSKDDAAVHRMKEQRKMIIERGAEARQRFAGQGGVKFLSKPVESFQDFWYGENELACVFRPLALEPLDATQRSVLLAVSVCFVFSVSALWTNLLSQKLADQKAISYVVNVLLTSVITAVWAIANRKVLNYFAFTERFPMLHSRIGRMVPSLVALTIAVVLDALCFIFLFPDASSDSCTDLFATHVGPFLANMVAHFIMPGVLVSYAKWYLTFRFGAALSEQEIADKLKTLIDRIEQIEREQNGGGGGGGSSEKAPLLA